MAFRTATVEVIAADDSDLDQVTWQRKATFYQTKDNEVFSATVRVGTSDAEAAISIAPVTAGYFFCLMSDYPVRVRLNGAAATQFTLRSNSAAATNYGAPLPDNCCMMVSGAVTEVRLEPIASATQTANVKILVTGDPTNAYT